MGLIKLRTQDVRLAEARNLDDLALNESWGPAALIDRYVDEASALGLKLVVKSSTWLRLSKISTTFYREIRLGSGWNSLQDHDKAVLLAHELKHARQWRLFGPSKFRTNYIFNTRWRWGIETQCYSESIRALVALGATEGSVDRYIESRVDALLDHYALGTLNSGEVRRHTTRILNVAHIAARGKVGR